ncbi:hypothetical protein M9H77_30434 [Catharanthus roseus]|uniref:Uncharacterized protein n=1 Tax=Catharanthus roseus TaxID=4058 RepID=A0ACB9ZX93_CATRO|nr:hypothetical protein M9H77_30434 [Catharanthus roseus]
MGKVPDSLRSNDRFNHHTCGRERYSLRSLSLSISVKSTKNTNPYPWLMFIGGLCTVMSGENLENHLLVKDTLVENKQVQNNKFCSSRLQLIFKILNALEWLSRPYI